MYSNTVVNKVLSAILILIISVTLIILDFGCDCDDEPDLDTVMWKVVGYLSMSDEERAAFMAKHETPKPIATPETRVKKDITNKGQAGESDSSGAPGGC
jgi:hypothetical protein